MAAVCTVKALVSASDKAQKNTENGDQEETQDAKTPGKPRFFHTIRVLWHLGQQFTPGTKRTGGIMGV